MRSHGAFDSFEEADPHELGLARRSTDYRNLVGIRGHPRIYRGLADDALNRRMFRWLARCMTTAFPWRDGTDENTRIPGGYTYLAQLVAHDVLQATDSLDARAGRQPWRRDARSSRLMLDTVYGRGPTTVPFAYTIERHKGAGGEFEWGDRVYLRLGEMKREVAGERASAERGGNVLRGRDLPRVSCPYHAELEDPSTKRDGLPDVLIPDARNDDNFILSQLTAVFHLFHNAVCRQLLEAAGNLAAKHKEKARQRAQVFRDARRLVTFVYRAIVFDDLLKLMLHPAVYEWYQSGEQSPFVRDLEDDRIPVEFSHAAYRVGHAMVRDSYTLNGKVEAPLTRILRLTSSADARSFPLSSNYLINWSRFFSLDDGTTINFSRRLAPSVSVKFVGGQRFEMFNVSGGTDNEGDGLMFRDLLRGAIAEILSVKSILETLPEELLEESPLVQQGTVADEPIRAWLDTATSNPLFISDPLSDTFVQSIATDPPLMLFILLEAALTARRSPDGGDENIEAGQCLGIVGSFVIADFLYAEREKTRYLIEEDEATIGHARQVFGDRIPRSMPELLIFINKNYQMAEGEFIG